MHHFFPRIAKSTLIEAALGFVLLHAPLLCEDSPSEDEVGFLFSSGKVKKTPGQFSDEKVLHNTPSLKELNKNKDTYTINFSNISIIEYIKFASKITNLNFVFNDDELQFNVTVVSEEPVTPRNIMSILIQVLRINGLIVLEQDNNLLITKVRNVSQLATVIASDLPEIQGNMPLVTRVFRIKNANLNTVASVIKPMLSDSALLEVSGETKQLIITDITTNVDKISSLLASIDTPHSHLEIDSYVARSSNLEALIKLATQIVSPFSEGNTLTFVPQTETQTIFIVSTPFLIERAMAILEDLETSNLTAEQMSMRGQIVYLYKLQHKRGDDFINALNNLSKQLNKRGASEKLVDTLTQAKWIKESNSILFIADEQTLNKIKELIPTLDTSAVEVIAGQKSNFYVYKIQQAPYEQLENSIDAMAENLQKAPQPDYALIDVLTSVKYIPDANSLIFTGDTTALSKLAEILPSFDVASNNQGAASQFLIYNPRNRTGEQLEKSIQEIAQNLKNAGLADPLFLQSVKSAKWTASNNSLIFTGSPDTLARIQSLLVSLDGGTEGVGGGIGGQTFYLYKLQSAPGNTVIDSLKKVSANLNDSNIPNQALISTLHNIKWIKENNSLLLTGSSTAIDQARTLIAQFDVAAAISLSPEANKSAFYIYKPVHQKPQVLQSYIQDMAKDLAGSGLIDPDLLLTLNTMRYVDSTNSLLFTGTPDALDKVKEILARIDVISPQDAQIQQLGESTFLIYKIQYVPSAQLISALKGLTNDLQRSGAIDQSVVTSINNLKYIKDTNSILFTGTAETLQKLETILKKFDSPSLAIQAEGTPTPSTFIVYTPKYIPGDDLIKILEDFEQNLAASGIANRNLFDTISNLKYIPRTCSLIISGDQESIAKVEELLRRFDVPTSEPAKIAASIESIQNTSFLIYKLEYHQGDEILTALKQIATDLGTGTATSNQNLLNAINSLQWIRVTNSLLASGEAETLTKLRDLVVNLDIPLRQVFIEVLVIETTLTNTQNFGLQWGGKMQYLNRFAAGTGNFPAPSTNTASSSNPSNPQSAGGFTNGNSVVPGINAVNATTTPSSGNIPFMNGFDLGVIGDIIMHKGRSFISLGSLVNALQTDTDSTVVLNPKIITQDNRTSTLFVGTNVPFIGSQVTSTTSLISSSSNIEYRDVGFNLTITPTIGNSNIVTLDISNDISQVIANPNIGNTSVTTGGTNNIQGITSSHTSMTTRVHVPDQHFVVLSGMIQDTKTRYKSAIPCLGGLPVIGAIFSENDRADNKVNVIIFLRPYIVNTYDDYKKITDEQECLYKDQAVMPVLKEEFDAGIDTVKRSEDE
jgi:type II secretory pathway component GspD/PulD (secretin)